MTATPAQNLEVAPGRVTLSAGRVEGWDLLRGVAMSLVLIVHALDAAGLTGHEGMGVVALTSFFVLSGYLITGILLRDIDRHGRIRVGAFYRNRAVRLLPALGVVLVAYGIAEAIIDRTPDPILLTALIGITYVGNLPVLRDLTGTMRQLWSLAFEEQFYLVWPTVLAFALRRKIAAPLTLCAVILSTLILLGTLAISWDRPERIYTLPTTWAAPVLIGCLGSLQRERWRSIVRPTTRAGLPLLLGCCTFLVLCSAAWQYERPLMYLGGPMLAGAACLVIVLWLEEWHTVRSSWLRPIVGLGTISYAAYLWNYPVAMYVHLYVDSIPGQIVISVALSIVFAILSWFLVEKPAQRWRVRSDARRRARLALNQA